MPHATTPAGTGEPELVVAADPVGRANPALAAAAHRAGGTGLLDVHDVEEYRAATRELERRRALGGWLRPGPALLDPATDVAAEVGVEEYGVVVLDVSALADRGTRLEEAAAPWQAPGRRVVAQVTSREQAVAAAEAGLDGLLAVGCEAGGRVGETEAFILLQQVVDLGVPVWLRGGVGLHTTAAVVAGGGTGVVLDTQLGLLKEACLPRDTAAALHAMDGSETRVLGEHRVYVRPDLPAARVPADTPAADVDARLGDDLHAHLVPFGQDSGVARAWAERFVTVGGALQAVRRAVTDHLADAVTHAPLAPGAGVAGVHGTTYPVVQGPMTRVSDRAEFAAAVAEGGGLPFLALALMPADEVRDLLARTRTQLGGRAWGVGLLGFAPPELLTAQLAEVHAAAPPFVLLAGGRPSQAAALEESGIHSYLHVPSPGLLDRFLAEGARSFVFEGRECGGHVGPRSSFALWEAQVERLLDVDDPQDLRVLLAGGIHDARSAAMASAVLAPLAARGARCGVLMGTAYLFTTEAVEAGAVLETFQDVAVDCDRTVLLETAPGHATRCVETEFVRTFAARRAELEAAGVEPRERWAELEQLNLGRLRIASKGLVREERDLVAADVERQLAEGMYMIGSVATLRDDLTTITELHASVSAGSVGWLREHLGLGHSDAGDAAERTAGPAARTRAREADPLDVAIIGMETFLPGAVGADRFWANVLAGTDHVTEVPHERWDAGRHHDPDTYARRGPGRGAGFTTPSRWGGFLEAIGFDPLVHGIPPASLAAIEPVQLLSLEVAARALADAGYASRPFDRERASVVFGAESGNELGGAYGVRAFLSQVLEELPPELDRWLPTLTEDSFPGVLANVIAGRIANRLDLGGVNYTVDAACGSSLAALDAGCKELRTGASDLVLVGGADLHNGLNDYLMFSSVHALSPSGRCRTFDAAADGIALGEGVAAVVLKRRVDAERDGDRIYAVIDAVAGSSDGRHLGLTAPRKEGQQRAVTRALDAAGVAADEIGLVEAHGTGTVVGDRTEMATLTELFAEAGAEPGSVVLGSVKSQIGHTKCTAGLAGLVKAARAVHHAVLPPTVNLAEPNPYFDPESSPFRFLDRARPWAASTRRAGVSAFGFGGTNFHAVLSSYDAGDAPAHGTEEWPAELFLLRGTDEVVTATVAEVLRAVEGVLASDPTAQRHRLRDLARTVSTSGRGQVRAAFVASSFVELAEQLRAVDLTPPTPKSGGDAATGSGRDGNGKIAFLHPGQGSQRPGMLSDLFVTMGGLDDLVRLAEPWAEALFPPAAFTPEERAAQRAAITATDTAQPTLGVTALAMTRLLRRVGVRPDVTGGHSYGELAALAVAGCFDDATLISLSAARGQAVLDAVQESGGDPGTMAAVALDVEQVRELLTDFPDLVVANHNAPRQVVVSGPTASVRAAVGAWEANGVRATLLPVACAFHSPLVGAASTALAEVLADVEVRAPQLPVWSNTTAEPYPDDVSVVRELLAEQVSEGVRFVDQVESMYAAGVRTFVEVGPGRVLAGQVAKILGERPHTVVVTDVPGENGVRCFLEALAQLARLGVEVDTAALFEERAATVDLATWPRPAPGWTVDGAFVRRADGTVVPNSFQPADALPDLALPTRPGPERTAPDRGAPVLASPAHTAPANPAARAATPEVPVPDTQFDDVATAPPARSTVSGSAAGSTAGSAAEAVVTDYLRSLRQVVAAERDVVLAYLGAGRPPVRTEGPVTVPQGVPAPAEAPEAGAPEPVVAPLVTSAAQAEASRPADVATNVSGDATGANEAPDVLAAVREIVAARTGYPVDMLDVDLDLEADLSIDSIKRIEIVGELAQSIGLGTGPGELADHLVEELSRHRTLRAIVAWIEQQSPTHTATDPKAGQHHVPAGALGGEALLAAVREIVAARTGYPVDMLEPDLDLEADLSIDSIKRIEIVGELAQTIGLGTDAGTGSGELADHLVEELSRHRTLRAIVAWIEEQAPGSTAPSISSAPSTRAAQGTAPAEAAPDPTFEASRWEIGVEALGPTVPLGSLLGASVALVEGHPGLTDAVQNALLERGAQVVRLPGEPIASGPDDASEEPSAEHAQLLGEVDVLVDLATTSGDPRVDARDVFVRARPALLGRVQRVLAVGVSVHASYAATGAGVPTGLAGMFRSLSREREDLLVRHVEVEHSDLAADLVPLAVSLVDELLDHDAPATVSWVGGTRTTRVARPAEEPRPAIDELDLGLDTESVVVLTGGARGITARVAEGIARATPCRLVLVGRSPYPTEPEDPRLAEARTVVELRRRVLELARSQGAAPTPAEVERSVARVGAAREVLQTLQRLRALGCDAEYVEMDVRSPGFGALLDALHATFGRLDGVIHGAGVLDDHLVEDKTPEGFDRVFGTKVDGARTILDRQHLGMRFVVLFGSVSGVFGNKGQVDYAAANDALDTLARAHDGRHDCRVVALDWGPWAGGGMVSPELEREYARRGVGLLAPEDGVAALLGAVAGGTGAQLVVMAGSPEAFAPQRSEGRAPMVPQPRSTTGRGASPR